MIKQGIKNFFTSFKYFFTPLGTMALGFVIGVSILIPGVSAAVKTLVANIKNILGDTNIDLTALKNCITTAVQELDWTDPFKAVQTMINSDWLTSTLNECVGSLVENAEAFSSQIGNAVLTFSNKIVSYIAVVIVFTVLGMIGGFWLTKWLIRRNIAKRSLWKYLLVSLVDSLLVIALFVYCAWFVTVY